VFVVLGTLCKRCSIRIKINNLYIISFGNNLCLGIARPLDLVIQNVQFILFLSFDERIHFQQAIYISIILYIQMELYKVILYDSEFLGSILLLRNRQNKLNIGENCILKTKNILSELHTCLLMLY